MVRNLEKLQRFARVALSRELLEGTDIEVEAFSDHVACRMSEGMVRAKQSFWAERALSISIPDGPWQLIKLALFTGKMLRKYPVRFREWNAFRIYPGIVQPPGTQKTVLRFFDENSGISF